MMIWLELFCDPSIWPNSTILDGEAFEDLDDVDDS
jgi:hypothetical protein